METKLLGSLGKAAGLAGISLGVLFLIFRSVLQEKFLPAAGLKSQEAYQIILAVLIFTFGIATIGIIAWIMTATKQPTDAVPTSILGSITLLTIIILGSAVLVGFREATETPRKDIPDSVVVAKIPPAIAPLPKRRFEKSITMTEQETNVIHGVTINVIGIGDFDEGKFVEVKIHTNDGLNRPTPVITYHSGDEISLFRPDCEELGVTVSNISFIQDVPNSVLFKLGRKGALYVHTKATFVVHGKCEEPDAN